MFDTLEIESKEAPEDEANLNEIPEESEEETEEADQETEEAEDAEESEEFSEDDSFVVGDREITPKELQRLEERAKNLESGVTKKINELNAEHKEKLATLEQKASDFQAKAELLESFLDEDESAVDWDDLSPGEIRKTEKMFSDRRKKIADAKAKAESIRSESQKKKLIDSIQAVDSYFAWKDGEQRQKAINRASAYATKIGYTPERLGQIVDSAEFIALIEASELQAVKEAKPIAKKKTKPAARKVKSKASKSPDTDLASLWYPS